MKEYKEYSECIEYLCSLGLPMDVCKKICKHYEAKQDMVGLIDYMLVLESMVDSCVD